MRYYHSISSGENAPAGPVNSNWIICGDLSGIIEAVVVLSFQECVDLCAGHPTAVGLVYEIAATEQICVCWNDTFFPSGILLYEGPADSVQTYAIGAPANPPLPTQVCE